MKLFDSHAHYTDEKYGKDRDRIIKEIYENGITNVINVGSTKENSKLAVEQALKYDFMYAAVRNTSRRSNVWECKEGRFISNERAC